MASRLGWVNKLDSGDQWMRSGIEACAVPGFALSVEADMTGCRALMGRLRARGARVTYTHFFVQAAARALAGNPDLHQCVLGNRNYRSSKVNIALSVAGDLFVAPMLLVEDAASKTLEQIAAEVAAGAPRVRREQRELLARLRRWGWLVPLASLRRALLRRLLPRTLWARGVAPALQVTGVSDVERVVPMVLLTTGILAAGRVENKPAVVRGEVVSRLQVTLTCCADHRVWDGRMAARFLNAVKAILESAGERLPEAADPENHAHASSRSRLERASLGVN